MWEPRELGEVPVRGLGTFRTPAWLHILMSPLSASGVTDLLRAEQVSLNELMSYVIAVRSAGITTDGGEDQGSFVSTSVGGSQDRSDPQRVIGREYHV